MANITISEISQNYSYNIGNAKFATVAMPITACWGPGYFGIPEGADSEDALESVVWQRFPATQKGLESFVSTYRGPSSNYRLAEDYSYQMAMTLLTAGYDVLTCRLCPGDYAEGKVKCGDKGIAVKAKYPGTFGNNLQVRLTKVVNKTDLYNIVTYVIDASGVKTAVENIIFRFEFDETANDSIPCIDEVESNFISIAEDASGTSDTVRLEGGSDKLATELPSDYSPARFVDTAAAATYKAKLTSVLGAATTSKKAALTYNEWLYEGAYKVYDLLKDKLAYSPNRVISPGWDDYSIYVGSNDAADVEFVKKTISPLHKKLMELGYFGRCAAALLDIPKCLPRSAVYSEEVGKEGYAQTLSRDVDGSASNYDINGSLYSTHSALFAPWGTYQYVGTNKQYPASPSFLALLIQRAMLLNQSLQYEWALPTNRKQNVKIGKLDYTVPKKVLDKWQKLEGVGVNAITTIPDIGTTIWGNSTLYEVPAATYQALANLSTRYLVNAVEDIVYRCGIAITFQYNNEQAYNKFYAGVTPTLDTMKNVGAIEDYYVKMEADINGLDQVNANTVLGKIYLVVNGVINDIVVDLVALPPQFDLNTVKS